MIIPKTLVIGVFLHGEHHLNNDGKINTGIVPDGIRVTVINAVAPGVPNLSKLEEYENMARQISTRIKGRKNYDKLTNTQINNLTENLRDLLVKENENQTKDIIKEHQHLYSRNNINPTFQQFAYQTGNAFKIKTYESNDTIPNKLFIKFSEGEIVNTDNIPENYFNNIILYNLEGEPDLFKVLESIGLDITHITLGQILDFLVNLGVENVIMVDLSCSTFKGNPEFLTERNIRQTRRQMI